DANRCRSLPFPLQLVVFISPNRSQGHERWIHRGRVARLGILKLAWRRCGKRGQFVVFFGGINNVVGTVENDQQSDHANQQTNALDKPNIQVYVQDNQAPQLVYGMRINSWVSVEIG